MPAHPEEQSKPFLVSVRQRILRVGPLWRNHLVGQLEKPRGWELVAKTLAGAIAIVVGLSTLAQFNQTQRSEEAVTVGSQISTIQGGLLSDNGFARIAALRALQAFARQSATHDLFSEPTLRSEAWEFPRRAIVQSFQAAKPYSPTVVGAAREKSLLSPSPTERYELLTTLDQLGAIGWNRSDRPKTGRLKNRYDLDFSWISHVVSKHSDDNTTQLAGIFDGYDFSSIRLRKAIFDCLVLNHADFSHADLSIVRFGNARLEEASFKNGNIEHVIFGGSNLRNANFDQAQIVGSSFSPLDKPINIRDAGDCAAFSVQTPVPLHTSGVGISFREGILLNSYFEKIEAAGSRFDAALISNVDFKDAILDGARFDDARLAGVSMNGASLNGASFEGATLTDIRFDGADLRNSSFSGAHFTDESGGPSLSRATSVAGANFKGVSGLGAIALCGLINRGAVVISNEADWAAAGRRRNAAEKYMNDNERKLVAQCHR